jgi:hypothetical protein
MDILDFLKKAAEVVKNLFSHNKLKDYAHIADDLVNKIKAAEGSPTGQVIENIIEAVIPASTGLISAIKLALPKLQAALLNVEEGKIPHELEAEFLNWLQSLKGKDAVAYAGVLTTINAWVQKQLAENSGIPLSPADAITAASVVHTLATDGVKYDSHGCIIGQEQWDSVQNRCVPNVGKK